MLLYLIATFNYLSLLQLVILSNEPVREKTNNFGSDQVQDKPDCTAAEDG